MESVSELKGGCMFQLSLVEQIHKKRDNRKNITIDGGFSFNLAIWSLVTGNRIEVKRECGENEPFGRSTEQSRLKSIRNEEVSSINFIPDRGQMHKVFRTRISYRYRNMAEWKWKPPCKRILGRPRRLNDTIREGMRTKYLKEDVLNVWRVGMGRRHLAI